MQNNRRQFLGSLARGLLLPVGGGALTLAEPAKAAGLQIAQESLPMSSDALRLRSLKRDLLASLATLQARAEIFFSAGFLIPGPQAATTVARVTSRPRQVRLQTGAPAPSSPPAISACPPCPSVRPSLATERMPVLLTREEEFETWLSDSPDDAIALAREHAPDQMRIVQEGLEKEGFAGESFAATASYASLVRDESGVGAARSGQGRAGHIRRCRDCGP